jgi:CRP-like cAMP-binding protein
MSAVEVKDEALENMLLAALPSSEFEKIRPSLELVTLEQGDALWEVEERRNHIYFPTSTMIALMHETDGGISAGIGIIGSDGVVGLEVVMEESRASERAVVRRQGNAFRMKARAVREEFSECGDFQAILLCYTQAMLAQITQTALCNRLHTVEQQLCRWFLTNAHEERESTFAMTHDQISNYLGVRRETVSLAAAELQNRGIIEYSRGKVAILDPRALKDAACECYDTVKEKYDQIMAKFATRHKASR